MYRQGTICCTWGRYWRRRVFHFGGRGKFIFILVRCYTDDTLLNIEIGVHFKTCLCSVEYIFCWFQLSSLACSLQAEVSGPNDSEDPDFRMSKYDYFGHGKMSFFIERVSYMLVRFFNNVLLEFTSQLYESWLLRWTFFFSSSFSKNHHHLILCILLNLDAIEVYITMVFWVCFSCERKLHDPWIYFFRYCKSCSCSWCNCFVEGNFPFSVFSNIQ